MQVTLTGNLGADPEMKQFGAGKQVLRMRVAVKAVKDGEPSEWVTVNVWGSMGETYADSLAKGDRVTVTGRPAVNQWTARDGTAKAELVVNAEAVGWHRRRTDGAPPATRQPMQHEAAQAQQLDDDDPFGDA